VPVIAALAQLRKYRHAVVVTAHRLAVDQAGAHAQRRHRLDDQREPRRPVVPVARQQPHAGGTAARHQPVAVMLDLVNPARTARRVLGG
jgi:hypothetical protein